MLTIKLPSFTIFDQIKAIKLLAMHIRAALPPRDEKLRSSATCLLNSPRARTETTFELIRFCITTQC